MLGQLDIDGKDLRVLRNLYWDQTAAVRVGGELSEYTNIKRGVRQGCVMSPDLFNLYSEVILRNLDGSEGLKANGENLNNLRYADDTSLLAGSEEDLQRLLGVVVEESERLGLSLNYNLCHGDCAEPEGGRTVVQSTAICMIPAALQAFDRVKHEGLFEMLGQLDIDEKDLRVLRNLYWDQTAAVRVGGELSEYTNIKRGVRQGCVMSPDLFNLYSEVILRNLDGSEGLKANGENLNNLRYADDTSLLAGSEEDLQRLLGNNKDNIALLRMTEDRDKWRIMIADVCSRQGI
ncbi:hypothetical protein RRG08_056681 [Elysia crispata]|uniref:Reverse transcriptase domain-containing protein n=1 Tax=Elysia crispata TaxID=231223 RepID=A0AAE1AHX5_9GAST|nr:hypothetical protein RRG08_056681 [Elysia crispata]